MHHGGIAAASDTAQPADSSLKEEASAAQQLDTAALPFPPDATKANTLAATPAAALALPNGGKLVLRPLSGRGYQYAEVAEREGVAEVRAGLKAAAPQALEAAQGTQRRTHIVCGGSVVIAECTTFQ